MDNAHLHSKLAHEHERAHGCCGGTHKQAVKEVKEQTGCGCGDKQAKPAPQKSSCCG